MSMNSFLIAAPQSGSGKTTISLGIMAAMRQRGLKVAAFKCGPDFIDPGYHTLATGLPSINLDGWMCPAPFVSETFQHYASQADISIIEGVMGLFDGIGAATMEGSSAQIAAITGSPVVLVVNVRGMAASGAALVKGFAEFDPNVRLAGVIFNNVGSPNHGDLLRRAVADALPDVKVFGCIPRDESLKIPSRHLGLVTAEDNPLPPEYLQHLVAICEQHLDMDALARLEPITALGGTISACVAKAAKAAIPAMPSCPGDRGDNNAVRIAVARDSAFCFVYEDNLRLLRECGADVIQFSPLSDSSLPADICGIYLPGGYPELYSERLAANGSMKAAISRAVAQGMPVYAECGGFIYLTQGMEASAGQPAADFVGVYPVRARMLPRRKALGYRQVDFMGDSVIAAEGDTARGHEFHYSEISAMPENITQCYRLIRAGRELGTEGYRLDNCLASYVHLHFGSNRRIAENFYSACLKYAPVIKTEPEI